MSQIANKGTMRAIVRDAIVIAGASALVALVVNALRTNSLLFQLSELQQP